jgi:hypothetical protein
MSQAFQTFHQFFADVWHWVGAEWLPGIVDNLILFWQWLAANPLIALILSAVLLLWACLVIRKSTHEGWNIRRSVLTFLLFGLGFAGILVVLQLI